MRWNYHGHGGSTQLATRFALLTIVAICVMALIGTARMSLAGDNRLLGTWKLKSFVRQNVATGERRPALGEHPKAISAARRPAPVRAFVAGGVRPRELDAPKCSARPVLTSISQRTS
jgi:hypothetical protein